MPVFVVTMSITDTVQLIQISEIYRSGSRLYIGEEKEFCPFVHSLFSHDAPGPEKT